MKRSLRKWYYRASPDQHQRGVTWYEDIRRELEPLGPADEVSAVFAALSPRIDLNQNIRGCIAIMIAAATTGVQPVVAGTTANRDKAWHIATTGDTSVLSGPKVTAFADNLADPDSETVTLDVWALRAYLDEPRKEAFTPTPRLQREAMEAYRDAAKQVGLRPAEFQAVVWNTIREYNHD